MESFMLRCKEGDLAVVICDEPGCKINVGRMVTVSGPVKVHERVRSRRLANFVAAKPTSKLR
jgi:hypothetical protein